jgi:hypothetical protein
MSMQSESPQFRVRERSRKESAAHQPQHVKSGQAVWQARLMMLVMINIAQLWVLGATVEAALARRYSVLWPLVISSGICFLISLSIILWWRPRPGKATSSGYVRTNRQD